MGNGEHCIKRNLLIYNAVFVDHYHRSETKVTLGWTRAQLEKKKKITMLARRPLGKWRRKQEDNIEIDLRDMFGGWNADRNGSGSCGMAE